MDVVRLVSPAGTPGRSDVEATTACLESLGLKADFGKHVLDRLGYLPGSDAARLEDFNDALSWETCGSRRRANRGSAWDDSVV